MLRALSGDANDNFNVEKVTGRLAVLEGWPRL